MAKLTHVSFALFAIVGSTAGLAAFLATGCSSSSPASEDDGGEEAQADAGQTQSDTGSVTKDATTSDSGNKEDASADSATKSDGPEGDAAKEEASTSDGSNADGTTDGSTGDAGDTGVATEAATEAAADGASSDGTIVTEATTEAAADGASSDGTIATEAGSDSSSDAANEAGEAAAACTTTIGAIATAADAGDAGNAMLLFGFDGVTGAAPANWSLYAPSFATAPSILSSTTMGVTCLGSLEVIAPFNAYGSESVFAQYSYATAADLSAYTTLFMSVAVTVPNASDYASLNGVTPFVSTGSASSFHGGSYVNISTFADGNFHTISVSLAPDTVADAGSAFLDPTAVKMLGVQLFTQSTAPGGDPTPPTATLYVDDVWVE